jgi:hypothetical protein
VTVATRVRRPAAPRAGEDIDVEGSPHQVRPGPVAGALPRGRALAGRGIQGVGDPERGDVGALGGHDTRTPAGMGGEDAVVAVVGLVGHGDARRVLLSPCLGVPSRLWRLTRLRLPNKSDKPGEAVQPNTGLRGAHSAENHLHSSSLTMRQ